MLCWSGIPFPTRFSHLGSYFACCPLSESWNGHGQPHYFYFGSILVNPHLLMVVLIYASNGSNGGSVANYVYLTLETLKLIYYSVPIARNVEQRFDWRKIANRQNGCNAQKDKRPWFRIDVRISYLVNLVLGATRYNRAIFSDWSYFFLMWVCI